MEGIVHGNRLCGNTRNNLGLFYRPKHQIKTYGQHFTKSQLASTNVKSPPHYPNIQHGFTILHQDLQNQIHKKLSDIYNRGGKSYSNPRLIAAVVMFGLDRTWIERVTKSASDGKVTNSVVTFKLRGNNLLAQQLKQSSLELDIDPVALETLNEVKDLNIIRQRVKGVIPLIVIESQSYRMLIPDYIRALYKELVVYSVGVTDGLADVSDPILRNVYLPIKQIRSIEEARQYVETGFVLYPINDEVALELRNNKKDKNNIIVKPLHKKVTLTCYADNHKCTVFDEVSYRMSSSSADKYIKVDQSGTVAMRVIMRFGYIEDFPISADDIYRSPKVRLGQYVVTKISASYGIRDFKVQRMQLQQFVNNAIASVKPNGSTAGINGLHLTASKGIGKTTTVQLFEQLFKYLNIPLYVIDSDDYGLWLNAVLPPYKYGVPVEVPEITPENANKKGEISYFNAAIVELIRAWKIASITDLRAKQLSGEVRKFADEFFEIFLPLFKRGSGSDGTLRGYVQMHRSLSNTKNVITCAHNNLESVHMAFTTANFNLIAPWTSQSALVERHQIPNNYSLGDAVLGAIYDYNQTQDVNVISYSLIYEWISDVFGDGALSSAPLILNGGLDLDRSSLVTDGGTTSV